MNIYRTVIGGFNSAFRGMRNPRNSWAKSDTEFPSEVSYPYPYEVLNNKYELGEADRKLAQSLIRCGSDHSKFLRMIHVQCDILAPRYFWQEFDTYKFVEKNSCSTIFRLLNNEAPITIHSFEYDEEDEDVMESIVDRLEEFRCEYLALSDFEKKRKLLVRAKKILPESYLQLRTIDTNYAELRNIYFQRRHHLLKEEWTDTFCDWVEGLPYANELILYEAK